jgi:hypothetical protein
MPHNVGAARRVLTLRALGARMRSILSCSIVYTVVPWATQNLAVVKAVEGRAEWAAWREICSSIGDSRLVVEYGAGKGEGGLSIWARWRNGARCRWGSLWEA